MYQGHAWVERRRLRAVEGSLEPPNLGDIVSDLAGVPTEGQSS
jgi:hypothetical protein